MQQPSPPPLTRRALLGATGIGILAAVSGCNPFSTSARTVTVTEGATTAPPVPQSPTVLLGLIFTTRLNVQNLTTAIAADKRDAALFATLLKDRQAHLAALESEYQRQFGAAPQSESAQPPAAPPATSAASSAAGDPDEVIGRIRGDASTAQNQFTDALSAASRFQAQLYGSIAACVATHRMVLA